MVTVYHPDGGRLMMTHYCSLHNQPRMRADTAPAENGKLVFNFVDATNMPSPDAMHMHKLVVTFVDKDHFAQEWTWKGGEKEGTEVFPNGEDEVSPWKHNRGCGGESSSARQGKKMSMRHTRVIVTHYGGPERASGG